MPRAKGVVFRFVTPQKTAQSARLFDCVQFVSPAGQYLVRIGLMPDIPDKPVVRRIENVMHRHGKFDGAKARAGVPAHTRTRFDDKGAQFIGDFL